VTEARYSAEVEAALARGAPVVALETSVLAHGLPPGTNLEAWRRSEAAVRAAGATPATIGLLDGEIWVGLSAAQAQRLADPATKALKVGSGDVAIAVASRACGGTTVSATCEWAARAKISLVATGGIGGVHRGAAESFDVSQDIWALSRFPVAVVCSGAKVILDLPKTLEALETQGVPVIGVGTRELPAFYCVTSGLSLTHHVDTPQAAAQIVCARLAQGLGGMVLAQPVPEDVALDRPEVERHLAEALAEASRRGVQGKQVTPFLLERLRRATGDRALKANVALLERNAGFAGQTAAWITSSS
jgi:pseudouridine-5'-phosphate glycosidase